MTTETRSAADLVAALEDSRKLFKDAVGGIADEHMTKPVDGAWSVKDQIAHVASWDELGAADVQRASLGHMPALASFKDEEIDDWNASLMRGRAAFTLPQVWHELDDRHNRLIEALKAAPEALVSGPLVGRLCDVIIEHDQMHAREISDWRQAAGV